ncbi:MAG: type IV pilus twitching motility protein PilT [Tissierellia bacterium]|nr:type IV pilus twitching motility protein PilT [Tissierellia bacterium]
MNIISLLKYAISNNASDIHITVGKPPVLRVDGVLVNLEGEELSSDDTKSIVEELLSHDKLIELDKSGQVDSSYSIAEIGQFRINAFKQRGSLGVAIRVIPSRIPTIKELNLPDIIEDLAMIPRGLILVTGPAGSGKSTTLASIIDLINEQKRAHIITLEDPIEYLHKHKNCIVNQREVGMDTDSFNEALRAALRQDPDVIMVGEMRDIETMSTTLAAAETGHLVFSTLHTFGAAKTISRIIDAFPPHQQHRIRVQLSTVIEAIISQQLLPKVGGKGRVVATEIMVATPAIRNLIREGKIHQIDTSIQTGYRKGMRTMDQSLLELFSQGIISKATLLSHASNVDYVKKIVL